MWRFRANVKITYISLKSQLAGGRPLEDDEEITKTKEEGISQKEGVATAAATAAAAPATRQVTRAARLFRRCGGNHTYANYGKR